MTLRAEDGTRCSGFIRTFCDRGVNQQLQALDSHLSYDMMDCDLEDTTQSQATGSGSVPVPSQGSESAASMTRFKEVKHALLPHETQPALPQTLEYLKPMTAEMHDKLPLEFYDMMDVRDQLDHALLDECAKPNAITSCKDRDGLVRRAETLVGEERSFLRKWSLELKKRERLLL